MSTPKRPDIRKRGYPLPEGVSKLEEGINFAIFSRHATRVTLVIDHWPEGIKLPIRHEFELDPAENRTGDMWHILLTTHQENFSYGYRMDGPTDPSGKGLVYDYDNNPHRPL